MRKSKFTPEQILQALRQAESGTTIVDICRKLGVTETTFYRWKKQYTGLDVSELRELKQLRDENRRLKGVVADLTLDKAMLRDALGKNGEPCSAARGRERGAGRLPGQRASRLPGAGNSPRHRPCGSRAWWSVPCMSGGRWTSCTTCWRRASTCASSRSSTYARVNASPSRWRSRSAARTWRAYEAMRVSAPGDSHRSSNATTGRSSRRPRSTTGRTGIACSSTSVDPANPSITRSVKPSTARSDVSVSRVIGVPRSSRPRRSSRHGARTTTTCGPIPVWGCTPQLNFEQAGTTCLGPYAEKPTLRPGPTSGTQAASGTVNLRMDL